MTKKVTPEQRARYYENAKIKRDAAAIAAGRVPGQVGQPSKFTADERREKQRLRTKKYRAANLEKMQAYHREYERKRAAEVALAEGREPGRKGPPALTPEERMARKSARSKKNYHENLEVSRERAARRARERRAEKKAGTYVPRKRAKMTDAERKLVGVQLSQARRARLKAADGKWNISDLRVMRWRQNGICPICNRPLGDHNLTVDHWVPLVQGGSNGTENMRLTHGSCNFSKGGKHPDQMRQPYELAAA